MPAVISNTFTAGSLAHDVMQQHVRGPSLARRGHGTNDSIRGQSGLEHVGLEPPVQDERSRGGQELSLIHI